MKNSNLRKTLVMIAAAVFTIGATAWAADDAQLKIDGDLMMHPDQVASFFALGAAQIKGSSSWSWQNMQFTQPYHTSWTNVTAVGPFDIQFDTAGLNAQDFGFTLSWATPRLTVGGFEIHDTLTQVVSGIPVTFHLDGTCSGMTLSIPDGQWQVKGHLHWDFASNQFVLSWQDFNVTINSSATPVIDVGQCQGPADMFKTMSSALGTLVQDPAWLSSVLKDGVLEWVQGSLSGLQTQLMQPRQLQAVNNVSLAWKPAALSTLAGGLIRVAGQFVVHKPGATKGAATLPRGYDPAVLAQVKESGFVMPKDTLQNILSYMYSNGELLYRAKSTDVSAFNSLMGNRFLQFFIWPDLIRFASNTLFYFDLTTGSVPGLSGGQRVQGGGSVYNVSGPLLVHQWAPTASGNYLPYVDFTSAVNGQLYFILKDGTLSLITRLQKFSLSNQFRSEFAATRTVSGYIATSLLGSQAKGFIEQTPVELKVPTWDFTGGLSLGLKDVQAWPDSFRVPLEFKTQP